jgi:hypothetical protein
VSRIGSHIVQVKKQKPKAKKQKQASSKHHDTEHRALLKRHQSLEYDDNGHQSILFV